MTGSSGPMAGVHIVDLSTMISGPMASQILADQGAEVIKVEAPPGGDGMRYMGPSRGGMSAAYHMLNCGKRSIVLDLKSPKGVETLRKLIARTDVLMQNFRPGVMERLGLDYDVLKQAHPQLIYVSISGFGEKGPLAGKAAFDNIMQCYAGFVAARGGDAEPDLIRTLIADKLTALYAAQAITAALYARAQGAGGQEVKLSMLGAALSFLWPDAAGAHHLPGDSVDPKPVPSDLSRVYRFRNGEGTFTGFGGSFAPLCKLLDAPAGEDPRLKTDANRWQEPGLMAEVEREFERATAEMDVDEGLAAIEATGAPCAKVLSFGELVEEEQVQANGYLRLVDHPRAEVIREAAPAAAFSATPLAQTAPASDLGADTGEILGELGE